MRILPPERRGRSAWPYLYGCLLLAYTAVFIAVLWIGAGFGTSAPTRTERATQPPAAASDVAVTRPAASIITASVALPTVTAPPTATPVKSTATPPPTPTPDPNVDFRVPLASSNTGVLAGQRVAIENITDDAQPAASGGRAPTGMKYIAVDVRIENTASAPTGPGAWRLRTASGQEIDAIAARGFPGPLTTVPIAPGASVTGTVVFVAPSAAKIAWIRYLPDPAYTGALYFDAA